MRGAGLVGAGGADEGEGGCALSPGGGGDGVGGEEGGGVGLEGGVVGVGLGDGSSGIGGGSRGGGGGGERGIDIGIGKGIGSGGGRGMGDNIGKGDGVAGLAVPFEDGELFHRHALGLGLSLPLLHSLSRCILLIIFSLRCFFLPLPSILSTSPSPSPSSINPNPSVPARRRAQAAIGAKGQRLLAGVAGLEDLDGCSLNLDVGALLVLLLLMLGWDEELGWDWDGVGS